MARARIQYSDVIAQCGGYYPFCTLVNRRIKEYRNGLMPMVEHSADDDEIEIVVREIEAGLLKLEGAPQDNA